MSNFSGQKGVPSRIYPERQDPEVSWSDHFVATSTGLFASLVRPKASRFEWIVEKVNDSTRAIRTMSDKAIRQKSRTLSQQLRREGYQDELVAESFALVREVSERVIGMRHFDVQLIGGLVLLKGMVAEMETGEGKTLVATLPACTAALAGVPTHIITVNDYLAMRDSRWMGPIYEALGLKVGTVIHGMDPKAKQAAYQCDVTYCTNKEVAFDYLRDRITLRDRPGPIRLQVECLYGEQSRIKHLLLRGLHFGIVDEADSVLIDEARTPLIISSEKEGEDEQFVLQQALDCARKMVEGEDFTLVTSERSLELTEMGRVKIGSFPWSEKSMWINRQQREHLVRQALVALLLFFSGKEYLVKDGKVQIIDEYTGRLMADRSWERGLHQLIEIKENCKVTSRKETIARISYQRFFRRYLHLAGMTGTAREVAQELWTIYRLRVVSIPTNRPLKRRGLPDRIYVTAEERWRSVVEMISEMHQKGRPVLVGTRSVAASEHLSRLLEEAQLPHRVLNARQDREEAEIIAQAGRRKQITVATNMAGRGTDIQLDDGVSELGGLHVIATERHDARRIDRQLFGRCGRQGDPGTYQTIASLEDELIRVYGRKIFIWIVAALLKRTTPFIGRWLGKFLFNWTQRTAQRLHARMRQDLLKMDAQLGDALAFSGRLE